MERDFIETSLLREIREAIGDSKGKTAIRKYLKLPEATRACFLEHLRSRYRIEYDSPGIYIDSIDADSITLSFKY